MTPQAIMDGMAEKNRMLTQKNDEMIELSERYAAAKRAYGIALATKITELRIQDTAATIALTLAKGDKTVAELRYQRDIAEGVFWACKDSIEAIKIQIDSYRSLLTWLRMEHERSNGNERMR